MKLLVTGGYGFIGSNFINLASKSDCEIINIDKVTYAADKDNIRVENITNIETDIAEYQNIETIILDFQPDTIVHFAAESHVDNSIEDATPFVDTNVTGTLNLLELSVMYKVKKFHHISTDEVYGSLEYDDTKLFTEDTPYDPRNPYSASKAGAEHMVRTWNNTYGLPYLITSAANNYGPRQHPEKLIPKVIDNALNGRVTNMYGGGQQIRDWIYVNDHCCAIWTLDQQNILNDKFNIAAGHELPNIEVTKKILDILDKPHSLIGVSNDRPGQDQRYGTDYSKLHKRTGWVPQEKFDTALESTVEWYLRDLPS